MKNTWKRIGVVAALLFSVSIPIALNVHADVTTPTVVSTVSKDGLGKQTVTVAVNANDIVVSLISADGPTSSGSKASVTGGLGLVKRANGALGKSEVWATKAAADGNLTISSSVGNYNQSFTTVVLRGSDGIGVSAGVSRSSGAPSVSVPARAGSLVYAAGNDWEGAVARVPASGQSLVHQWVNSKSGDTLWSQKLNSVASGTTVISDTSPTRDQFNYVGVEILPGGGGTPPTTTIPSTVPATTSTTTTTTTSSTTTVPNSGTACAPVPSSCGYPDATNTGPPPGTVLKRVPEDITSGPGWFVDSRGFIQVNGNGAVIDGITTKYSIEVEADNVTIKNSVIEVPGDWWAVGVRHSDNVTVDRNILFATNGTNLRGLVAVKQVYGDEHNTTVTGNNIYNFSTGVQIYGGRIADNYIHDMGFLPGDHLNGTTSNGGTEQLNIVHNTVFNQFDQTDAISLFEDFGVEANRLIENNLVAGGGYCIYGGQNAGGPTAYNIKILNNRFSRKYFPNCGYYGYLAAFGENGPGNSFWNNVWDENGAAIPNQGTPSGPVATTTTTTSPPTTTSSPTTTTAPSGQCVNGGTFLWANLVSCGWPGASNTGYPAGTALNTTSGRTINTNNAVIDGEQINGSLTINAQNVTIRNSLINYSGGGGGGSGAIKILAGASATIDRVEVDGNSAVHACVWHEGSLALIKGLKCHDVEDGVFSWAQGTGSAISGDNFELRDSYFHDLDANESNGHWDGYQTEGAANGLIQHNTFDVSQDANGAVSIWNGQKTSNNILVDNNLIRGGGFSVYAQDYSPSEASPVGGYVVTNVRFTNNKFSNVSSNCVGYWGVWFYRGAASWPYHGGPTGDWGANGNTRSGNKVLETGFNLDSGNPAGCF